MSVIHICLAMIVKNEEHIIGDTLQMILPHIDSYSIVDTGSTDKTIDIMRSVLAPLPGQIVSRPWVNFGHNRTECLNIARAYSGYGVKDPTAEVNVHTYLLMIDADDQLIIPTHVNYRQALCRLFANQLPPSAFRLHVRSQCGTLQHMRPHLFSAKSTWKYIGALHEYSECVTVHPENAPGQLTVPAQYMELVARCMGARSQDPEKYKKDALMLKTEHLNHPNETRTVFYLAQSYRDAGESELAFLYYTIRSYMSHGYTDEQYISLCEMCKHILRTYTTASMEELDELVKPIRERARTISPERIECDLEWVTHCRKKNAFNPSTYALAKFLCQPEFDRIPTHALFVNTRAYTYHRFDEFAIIASYTGHPAEAVDASERILREKFYDPSHLARLQSNHEIYVRAAASASAT